jgi:hypothetical protein
MPYEIFEAGEGGRNLSSTSYEEYSIGDLIEIDRKIRHMPAVVEAITKFAYKLVEMTGSENFTVILQDEEGTTRARAYAGPANNKGIHEQLSEHLLEKASINMEGMPPELSGLG